MSFSVTYVNLNPRKERTVGFWLKHFLGRENARTFEAETSPLAALCRLVTPRHPQQNSNAIGSIAALDQLCAGVIVTDNTGLIVEMNRAAEEILQLGDGLFIREGHLCARRVFETARVA